MEKDTIPSVFISHISQEKEIALLLDQAIRDWIGDSRDKVDIFTSSDNKSDSGYTKSYTSIELGNDWFEKILEKLLSSNVILVIASPLSVQRSWVNFELGAAWILSKTTASQKRIFACCVLGMKKGDLPPPLNRIESADLLNINDVEQILKTVGFGTSQNMLQKIAKDFVNSLRGIEEKYNSQQIQLHNSDESITHTSNATINELKQKNNLISNESIISNIHSHLSVPYDFFSRVSETKYKKRYQYGHQLALLNALDNQLTALTNKIRRLDGSTFRAMKYLVTRRLYEHYSSGLLDKNLQEKYYPYCLPIIEDDNWSFAQWWDQNITPFLGKLRQSSEFSGMSLRLPTFSEWQLLAQRGAGWTYNDVRECNLRLEYDDKRELCAVGVFPNGVSDAGCHDVIGNVWELCLEKPDSKYPSIIAGWSYEDGYQYDSNWWCTSMKLDDIITQYIGFRLVTIE